jgi:cytidine deaminase
MKSRDISLSWAEYDDISELNQPDGELVRLAAEASLNAYAPYSDFRVGAALRLESGRIVTGTNVENAAFPSGICAERNALSTAASSYPGDRPVTLAIAARNKAGLTREPVSPCGNCRQVITEEEYRNGLPVRIILYGKDKIQVIEKGGDLLPLQFNRDSLRADLPG